MIQRHATPNSRKANGTTAPVTKPSHESKTKSRPQNGQPPSMAGEWFRKFAHKTSEIVGNPWTFATALLIIVAWAFLGPAFGFSDTWQLVINTATTIVTFLMVFLIQNTQNRDAKAIHLKLDELIRAVKGARDKLIDLEDLSDEELGKLQEQFKKLGRAQQKESQPRNEARDK